MSYILDALKKSQNSRGESESHHSQPSSTYVLEEKNGSRGPKPEPQPKPTILSRWLWAIALALTVNGAITLYHHLSDPQHGAIENNLVANLAPKLRNDNLAENTLATNTNVLEKSSVFESQEPIRQDKRTISTSEQIAGDTKIPSDLTKATKIVNRIQNDTPPFIWQKSAGFQQKIPDMNIDMLYYIDKRPQRFVFVNMIKLREGDRVSKEVALHEIRPNELVLSYRGELFRVTAQR